MEVLDADPDYAWSHVRGYWFWGLMNVAIVTPIMFFILPFNIILTLVYPEGSIPKPGQPQEELTWMMWMNLFASRLYLPYNAFFGLVNSLLTFDDHVFKFTDFNLRYMEPDTVVGHFLVDWIMLVPIELQAIVMFFVTLPAWPWAITQMHNKYPLDEDEM